MSFSRAIFPQKVLLKLQIQGDVCQSLLVKNHVRMGGLFSGNRESSKSYREGTAQKWKSMAQPYKTKGLKKSFEKTVQDHFLIAFLAQKATATGLKKWSLAYKNDFFCQKKGACGNTPTEENCKKRQNRFKTGRRRSFRDVSYTKMHRKTRSTTTLSRYCAKTFKMKV